MTKHSAQAIAKYPLPLFLNGREPNKTELAAIDNLRTAYDLNHEIGGSPQAAAAHPLPPFPADIERVVINNLRTAYDRGVTKHSSQAVAAYPGDEDDHYIRWTRSAYDRGRADALTEKLTVSREVLARLLAQRNESYAFRGDPAGTPFKDNPQTQADYERRYAESIARRQQEFYDTADAILAMPDNQLVADREAVAEWLCEHTFRTPDDEDVWASLNDEQKIVWRRLVADLFESSVIRDLREVMAAALEVEAERNEGPGYPAHLPFVRQKLRQRAAKIREGRA